MFLLNVVLAFMWAGARGKVGLFSLALGFWIGFFLLWLCRPIFARADYFPRVGAFLRFLLHFGRELIQATMSIALAVLFRRREHMHPNILTVDVQGMSHWEILFLSHCITLTPGTTTVDVTKDLKTLYVHAFDASNPQGVRDDIEKGLKQPMLKFTRPC